MRLNTQLIRHRCLYSFLLIWVVIHTHSCTDLEDTNNTYLELYMNTEQDSEGYYLIDYNSSKSHSYTTVYFKTNDLNRVFWTSVDTFCVNMFNDKICDEIINYSTYSKQYDDGTWGGRQMIYLKRSFIGDTLNVFGCIDENTCDLLEFILE